MTWKSKLSITALLLTGCAARPYPHLNSRHEATAQMRVRLVMESLMLPDSETWRITVLPSDEWWNKLNYYSRGQARIAEGSGFTVPEWRHSYLNAQWVRSASNEDIARVLAHEWGHIACKPRCDDDEKAADDAGRYILRHP